MAKILEQTTTSNGDVIVSWENINKDAPNKGTIFACGAFGGGTLTATVSPNNGTDFVPLKNDQGTAITFTDGQMVNFELQCDENTKDSSLSIKLSLTGATSPAIKYIIFNNA